jgi:hypothetical protein
MSCEDPAVPLAAGGNGPDTPLLELPIYAIAPGGRPITGPDNFLFSDEVLYFGAERLRLVRWAPARDVRFPPPEQYPYFLWRARVRPPERYFLRDAGLVDEGGAAVERLLIGSAAAGAAGAGERLVSTQASGRAAYLYLQPAEDGGVEVRKAAGRIHDVALDFEPLAASARVPTGASLLLAGTALFGLRLDRENLELSLLGHFLGEDDLSGGVRVTSAREAMTDAAAWIHVGAAEPLTLTLQHR